MASKCGLAKSEADSFANFHLLSLYGLDQTVDQDSSKLCVLDPVGSIVAAGPQRVAHEIIVRYRYSCSPMSI